MGKRATIVLRPCFFRWAFAGALRATGQQLRTGPQATGNSYD
jgi:hypothetical protein